MKMLIAMNKSYTYKELCDKFSLPVLSGSYQKTQINKLSKDYQIEKSGRYYTVIKEYTAEEKTQNEIKGYYQATFEHMIGLWLANEPNYTACYSMSEIMKKSCMITDDYVYGKYNKDDFSEIVKVSPIDAYIYFDLSYDILKVLVKDVLSKLENKSLLKVRQGYRLFKKSNKCMQMKDILLGSKDETLIMEIEELCLKECGVDGFNELYKNKNNVRKFKRLAKEKCKHLFPEYEGFYKIYYLTLNKNGIKRNNSKIYNELNIKIQDKLFASKVLTREIDLTSLDKIVKATIDIDMPCKIKETILDKKSYKKDNEFE